MIQFNPDGSIKLPEKVAKKKAVDKSRMTHAHCMEIKKEIVSVKAPKSCKLYITLSQKITDLKFFHNIYKEFRNSAQVPSKLIMITPREYQIEIGTAFTRCSDCTNLIKRYKEHMNGNIIEIRGGCEYGRPRASFSFEDYFD